MAYNTFKDPRKFFNRPGVELGIRFLILGGLIGVVSGYVAILFHHSIQYVTDILLGDLPAGPLLAGTERSDYWAVILVPAFVGMLVAVLTKKLAPEAEGHGVPEIMNAVASNDGVIRPRVALVKLVGSALSIGSGFSVGREGPTALIGASLGSAAGQLLKLNRKRMKMVVGCGTAAGIAATFNAPLAGAAFALELVVGNFSVTYLSPIIFSSMLATVVARMMTGNAHALFSEMEFVLQSPWEIILYCCLGMILGLVGVLYTRLLYFFEDKAEHIPLWLRGALGGAIIGTVLLYLPEISGPNTWEVIRSFVVIDARDWDKILYVGLLIAGAKMVFTSLSLSSGASGGLFAPSLLIGGALGAPFGVLVNRWLPGIADQPGGYALVAMGALVAAITQAPMTAIIIIFELTNDYEIVLPLIMACAFSMGTYNHLQEGSIYTLKLLRRGINLQWGRDIGVLQAIRVADILKPETDAVDYRIRYSALIEKLKATPRNTLPVIDESRHLLGLVSIADVPTLANSGEFVALKDFMIRDPAVVAINESLYDAFVKITVGDYSYLPVVNNQSEKLLVGRLTRQDLLQIYRNQLKLRGIY